VLYNIVLVVYMSSFLSEFYFAFFSFF